MTDEQKESVSHFLKILLQGVRLNHSAMKAANINAASHILSMMKEGYSYNQIFNNIRRKREELIRDYGFVDGWDPDGKCPFYHERARK